MPSIYDTLLTLEDGEEFDEKLNSIVVSNLVGLLKASCGIVLPHQKDPFVYNDFSETSDGYFEMSYNFKYGTAYLSTIPKEHNLKVSFAFSESSQKSLHKQPVCYIDVDHNMNFEKALFKRVFEYAESTPNSSLTFSWSVLLLNTTVNSDLTTVNEFSYQNNAIYSDANDHIHDLAPHGLNPYYLGYNKEFHELLFVFLALNSCNPQMFYEVFPEYPSRLEIISSIDNLMKVLELFYQQYNDDKCFLVSRVSLIEMRLI